MNKLWALVKKEWREVFRQRIVLFSTAFMPLIVSAIPVFTLYSMRGVEDISQIDELGNMLVFAEQACIGLSSIECAHYLLLQQFMLLFLLVPVIVPVTIAAYSIVGEKAGKTLEPLLATPISTTQLLLGKALAAVLPAMAATLLGFAVYLTGTALLSTPTVLARLLSPLWLLGVFIVGPLLSIASVSFAVMISSRVNDPRVAEQLSALVMLPILALFVGQILGLLLLDAKNMLLLATFLVLLDAALLFFATQLFQRETILTRWK